VGVPEEILPFGPYRGEHRWKGQVGACAKATILASLGRRPSPESGV